MFGNRRLLKVAWLRFVLAGILPPISRSASRSIRI